MPSQYRRTIFVLRASCTPLYGRQARRACDRARIHTSHRNPIRSLYWRSKARTPHWASVAAVPPGHVSRSGAQAQGDEGCSRRIGSVRNDSAVRVVTRGGTRRFATLHSAFHRAAAFLEPRSRRTGRRFAAFEACTVPLRPLYAPRFGIDERALRMRKATDNAPSRAHVRLAISLKLPSGQWIRHIFGYV